MQNKKMRSTRRRAKRAATEGGSRSNETRASKPPEIKCGLFARVSLLREAQSNAQASVFFVPSWPVRDT